MRALFNRKLVALGYSKGQRLKIPGVEASCLSNQQGDRLLLVSNVFYGPSWAQIFKALEHLVPQPKIITIEKTPAVLISDSAEARDLVGNLLQIANASRSNQVHLEGVGFVELNSKLKPNRRFLVLSLASVVCTIALGLLWVSGQPSSSSETVAPAEELCVADFSKAEFEGWLRETLSAQTDIGVGKNYQASTPNGELNILVERTLSSTAKISRVATYSAGRQRLINHRIDISGSGAVLELGSS